MTAGSN